MPESKPCPTPWKVRHLTAADAERNMRDLKRHCKQNKKRLNLLSFYLCSCGAFHVGHNKYKTQRSTRFALAGGTLAGKS